MLIVAVSQIPNPVCPGYVNYLAALPSSFTCANGGGAFSSLSNLTQADIVSGIQFLPQVSGILQNALSSLNDVPTMTPGQLNNCTQKLTTLVCSTFFPACNAQCEPMLTCLSACEEVAAACWPATSGRLIKTLLANGAERPQLEQTLGDPAIVAAVSVLLATLDHCELARTSGDWPPSKTATDKTPQSMCDFTPAKPLDPSELRSSAFVPATYFARAQIWASARRALVAWRC